MIRKFLPRVAFIGATFPTLTGPVEHDVDGFCLCIEWLGCALDISFGVVRHG